MTVRCYIHSIAKRAETIALVDSGATENFINLSYAKWLRLPIKQLSQSRRLFNVDGTENKAGELKFYTDLRVQTGGAIVPLRFFLSDLGEHKAILGYSWFAAVQPKIDWKNGWIDHSQLPIILKADNATKDELQSIRRSSEPKEPVESPRNTRSIEKYSARRNPNDYPCIRYGTTQSNSFPEPQ